MALNRVWMPSPCYSSRGGAVPRLLVIHTAEGARTIESLGNWFANPAKQVSSHTGADDKANTVGEFVRRGKKAWTQGNANPVALSIECCGFAAWSAAEWDSHPAMLANCAAWLAEESAATGIPLVKLTPAEAQGSGRGVCFHSDLGAWGGNHSDPGAGFPIARVLSAAGGAGPAPGPDYGGAVFLAYATTDSANDPSIKRNFQYVIKESGTAMIATPADSSALAAKLGPMIGLTGNQIAAFK